MWKKLSIERLKNYNKRKLFLESQVLKQKREKIDSDEVLFVGGERGGRNAVLDEITYREEIMKTIRETEEEIAITERGLQVLSKEEKEVIFRFFMDPAEGAAKELSKKLSLSERTVYRIRDYALRKFTFACCGKER